MSSRVRFFLLFLPLLFASAQGYYFWTCFDDLRHTFGTPSCWNNSVTGLSGMFPNDGSADIRLADFSGSLISTDVLASYSVDSFTLRGLSLNHSMQLNLGTGLSTGNLFVNSTVALDIAGSRGSVLNVANSFIIDSASELFFRGSGTFGNLVIKGSSLLRYGLSPITAGTVRFESSSIYGHFVRPPTVESLSLIPLEASGGLYIDELTNLVLVPYSDGSEDDLLGRNHTLFQFGSGLLSGNFSVVTVLGKAWDAFVYYNLTGIYVEFADTIEASSSDAMPEPRVTTKVSSNKPWYERTVDFSGSGYGFYLVACIVAVIVAVLVACVCFMCSGSRILCANAGVSAAIHIVIKFVMSLVNRRGASVNGAATSELSYWGVDDPVGPQG